MGTAVLISIRPKWCALISKGEKTIEVRKTAPKLTTPFKCYIYCTKDPWKFEEVMVQPSNRVLVAQGKVIGEFVCDAIEKHWLNSVGCRKLSEQSCVPASELHIYAQPREWLFGWHISDLVIYDKPKELSEFHTVCNEYEKPCSRCFCSACNVAIDDGEIDCFVNGKIPVKRPPQSWQFVEELK